METETQKLLNQAKAKLGIRSDYELARRLGITRQGVSNYRRGISTLDNYAAVQLARIIDEDPLKVIAKANAERETDNERKEFWEQLARGTKAGMIALAWKVPALADVRAENLIDSTHYILYAMGSKFPRVRH